MYEINKLIRGYSHNFHMFSFHTFDACNKPFSEVLITNLL